MEDVRPDTGPLRDFLRKEMRARGWTQKQLAVRMGVSASAVTRWLSGEVRPEVSALQTAALRMGWDLDMLLSLAGHRRVELPLPSRQEQLCAGLRTIHLTDERFLTFSTLIERYARTDREAARAAP